MENNTKRNKWKTLLRKINGKHYNAKSVAKLITRYIPQSIPIPVLYGESTRPDTNNTGRSHQHGNDCLAKMSHQMIFDGYRYIFTLQPLEWFPSIFPSGCFVHLFHSVVWHIFTLEWFPFILRHNVFHLFCFTMFSIYFAS